MTTPERRTALATQIEQTAADDGFAALAALAPRGTPNRVAELNWISRRFAFALVVARNLRKQVTP